jgi:hypothetical protein
MFLQAVTLADIVSANGKEIAIKHGTEIWTIEDRSTSGQEPNAHFLVNIGNSGDVFSTRFL